MAKLMKGITLVSLVLTAVFLGVYSLSMKGVFLPLAITFGTIFYHFCMRLAVGGFYDGVMKNRADYRRKWYRLSRWEAGLYEKLHVKQWKDKMPTYDAQIFDPKVHSWDEIAQATCQAELVHETVAVLSFLPLFASKALGAFPVFLITSLLAAMLDLLFVMIQRYNRPRLIRIAKRQKTEKSGRPFQ